MKRLLILLILIFTPFLAESRGLMMMGGGVKAAGGQTSYTRYITTNTTTFNGITYSACGAGAGCSWSGVIDANIKENASTTNYGSATTFEAVKYDAGDWTHGLLSFTGLSNIPSTATVTKVTIGLKNSWLGGSSHVITVNRLLRDWVVGQTTWTIYSTGNNWGTAGGGNNTDRSATTSATFSPPASEADWVTFDSVSNSQLATDVQGWVTSGSVYGWRFERTDGSNDSTYDQFDSSDSTNGFRPYLKIEYDY
jgi:hypothetical protein